MLRGNGERGERVIVDQTNTSRRTVESHCGLHSDRQMALLGPAHVACEVRDWIRQTREQPYDAVEEAQ